jgi:hypothetical protein
MASPSNAEDVHQGVESFVSQCLKQGPRFDETIKRAKQEEWPSLAADLAMAFTPVVEPRAIEGWIIGGGEETFEALVVFKADVSGRKLEGCTVALSSTDAASFDKELAVAANAKSLGDETGADTIYKRYRAHIGGRDSAITLALPRYPKGSDQVLASAVAEEIVEN